MAYLKPKGEQEALHTCALLRRLAAQSEIPVLTHLLGQRQAVTACSLLDLLLIDARKAAAGHVDDGLLESWHCFPEVKQNWFGFSLVGNGGSGLGIKFARTLHVNLHALFPDFGSEIITESSHLEKVCLIAPGVGRDNISDFVTNLIQGFLCDYTEKFATAHLAPSQVKRIPIRRASFNFETEAWETKVFTLPYYRGDFILLTPRDMLTRDENWINRGDMLRDFESIPATITDPQLRATVNNYFYNILKSRPEARRSKPATQQEKADAAAQTISAFPQLIDFYIKLKEIHGNDAVAVSSEKVIATELFFRRGFEKSFSQSWLRQIFTRPGLAATVKLMSVWHI